MYWYCSHCVLHWVPTFGAPDPSDRATWHHLCPRCGREATREKATEG